MEILDIFSHWFVVKIVCLKRLKVNKKRPFIKQLCYAEIKYCDWLKMVTWLAAANLSALFQISLATLLLKNKSSWPFTPKSKTMFVCQISFLWARSFLCRSIVVAFQAVALTAHIFGYPILCYKVFNVFFIT